MFIAVEGLETCTACSDLGCFQCEDRCLMELSSAWSIAHQRAYFVTLLSNFFSFCILGEENSE